MLRWLRGRRENISPRLCIRRASQSPFGLCPLAFRLARVGFRSSRLSRRWGSEGRSSALRCFAGGAAKGFRCRGACPRTGSGTRGRGRQCGRPLRDCPCLPANSRVSRGVARHAENAEGNENQCGASERGDEEAPQRRRRCSAQPGPQGALEPSRKRLCRHSPQCLDHRVHIRRGPGARGARLKVTPDGLRLIWRQAAFQIAGQLFQSNGAIHFCSHLLDCSTIESVPCAAQESP